MGEIRTLTNKQQDTERGIRAAAAVLDHWAKSSKTLSSNVSGILKAAANDLRENQKEIATGYIGE